MRLFSVLRFESVIHEFDPWFNFRSTKYLVSEGALHCAIPIEFFSLATGFYNFHNWFDNMSWYPLGRFIGGTVYPGRLGFSVVGCIAMQGAFVAKCSARLQA